MGKGTPILGFGVENCKAAGVGLWVDGVVRKKGVERNPGDPTNWSEVEGPGGRPCPLNLIASAKELNKTCQENSFIKLS